MSRLLRGPSWPPNLSGGVEAIRPPARRQPKMGSKVEYVESSQMYATNYVRNSRAIGVLWGIFTICYAIIGVVAFVTPEWIGGCLTSRSECSRPGQQARPFKTGHVQRPPLGC